MTTLNFEYPNADGGAGGGDAGNVQLLRDIEEISKSLYIHPPPQKPLISSRRHEPESTQKTHHPASKSKPKSKLGLGSVGGGDERLSNQKKSSVWQWKPFRALSHIRQKKLNCFFFCHVHCVENLHSCFDDLEMSVHWKRKDCLLKTPPLRVSNGMVAFEETLMDRCLIYCSRSGPGNFVRYEPEHFLLLTSIVGAPELDLGRHWVDLTRLLPLTLEELEEEDKRSGKWTTSFKLGGKAKGAILHVSFGFLVMTDDLVKLTSGRIESHLMHNLKQDWLGVMNPVDSLVSGVGNDSMLGRAGSDPGILPSGSSTSSCCSHVKVLHQFWPNPGSEFSDSVNLLYKKLDEENLASSEKSDNVFTNLESLKAMPKSHRADGNNFVECECNETELTITEGGTEVDSLRDEHFKFEELVDGNSDDSAMEVSDVSKVFKDEYRVPEERIRTDLDVWGSIGSVKDAALNNHNSISDMEFNFENLDVNLCKMRQSESMAPENRFPKEDADEEIKSNHGPREMVRSKSLDAITKAVADEFCKLLGQRTSPSTSSHSSCHESPRERLLKEFEQDMTASGNFLFDFDGDKEEAEMSRSAPSLSCSELDTEDLFFLPPIDTGKINLTRSKSNKNKNKPQTLECLETQSLMQRWGLDEEEFQSSSHYSTGGFGSPVYLSPEEDGLPPLAEGLGSLIHLKEGGLLRSINRSLFHDPENGGILIIQSSQPIVLPAKMGCDVLEVLQCLASIGLENLSKKVSDLMPLEEISGKIMQQLSQEASSTEDGSEKVDYSQQKGFVEVEGCAALGDDGCLVTNSIGKDTKSVCVSTQNLVPLVMDRIEYLVLEGLRIQFGMSDVVAPSVIDLRKRSSQVGDADAQQLTVSDSCEHTEEALMDLSIPLDEWLRLDSRIFPIRNKTSEDVLKLLAAHEAKFGCLEMEELEREKKAENGSLKCGLLGDNPVVALTIQLRDPVRNFEPVGAPILGLIKVNRTFDHSTPAISSEDSAERTNAVEEIRERVICEREEISKFIMKQAHVAGLSVEPDDQEIWATRKQKQAGHRWLLSNNMNKMKKPHLCKSNAITRLFPSTRKQQSANTLWSISHESGGLGDHWGEISTQNSYLRNPDIFF